MNLINFAQKAFIVYNNTVLLIKRSKDAPNQVNDKWEVPGGRIEYGESITDHIQREVKEEVGLEIDIGSPFDIWTFFIKSENGDNVQVVAAARICSPKTFNINISGQIKSDYICEAKWVPFNNLFDYEIIPNMIPTVKRFIDIIGNYNER
jgi:8-oxo-dGTP pyrophosphatase MutT (NUDIX family)